MSHDFFTLLRRKLEDDDVEGVAAMIGANRPNLAAIVKEEGCAATGCFAFVRSTAMADLLLREVADAAQVSAWWATGFGLHAIPTAVAEHLVERGAVLTAHAAAALGLTARLGALLDTQPALIEAKGGDGCRPLHFSRDVATARLLVERGVELDPRDEDHDSTPAQWRIGDAPEVTRFLLERGARADIFLAAGLGDFELVRKLVAADPACTTYRIGHNKGPFPGIGFHGRGGTILQWTLGFNASPHEIAHRRGHREIFDFLMLHTPPRQRLLAACMLADRTLAKEILARSPGLIGELDDEDRALLAKCCWETNLNRDAVRLMLDLGFPIDTPEFSHGFQALHNAAWCGDAELVELLLQRGHPVDRRDPRYHATALGFAIHSCTEAKRHPDGDFPKVVRLLLEAGTPLDEWQHATGDAGLDAVIGAFRKRGG